jgi:hypothetical protein
MKSYKTTIIGVLGAIWLAIQPTITNGNFDLNRDWKNLVGAVLVAAFGFLVKDFNVSGTTTPTDASATK